MSKLLQIIDIVRDGERSLDEYGYLSTSEWLIVCLGLGTAESISALAAARYPTIPEAWDRIGESGRAIVLQAWEAAQ